MRTTIQFLLVTTTLAMRASALDPTQPADSYIRTNFTLEDGLPSNLVTAIVQTGNGFLWVGTDSGLARFNGRRFTPIYFRGSQSSPQGVVLSLAVAPDGDLWIGTGTGLARIPKQGLDVFDRSLAAFYHPGSGKSDEINCLRFNRDGSLWIGTSSGLFRRAGSQVTTVLPQIYVSRLEESVDGHMLVTGGKNISELDATGKIVHPELPKQLGVPAEEIFDFFQDRGGSWWFCTNQGIFRKTGTEVVSVGPIHVHSSPAFRIVEDHQGNLWVFSNAGLSRATATGLELLAPQLNAASAYTDRDGTLWVGRKGDGLVRFKDRSVRMVKPIEGPLHTVPMTVFTDHEGRLWVGSSCGGISLLTGTGFKRYWDKDGLTNSCVYALAEDAHGDLWIGTWGGGLFRFSHGKFTQYMPRQGLAGGVVKAIVAARDGSLWIATDDGLSHFQDGKFRNFTTADGLSSNRVINVFEDRQDRIWVATREGVNRLSGERFLSINSTPQIFDNHYIGFAQNSSGSMYALAAPKGISRIEGRLVAIDSDIDVLSMLEVAHKDFWFAGANGIFRLPEEEIDVRSVGAEGPFDFDRFGRADGLTSPQCSLGVPNMTTTPDGKLWVATPQGLAVLDLAQLRRTNQKAEPYLDETTVGRAKQAAGRELTIPPGSHHVELHFDSVELASPEKIRFQYRLDDVDSSWLDADATQSAVYTSIPIGAHLFHVRACNKDGVWDRAGITFPVTQEPYFYESTSFKIIAIGITALGLICLYQIRVRYLAQEIHSRLHERLAERERIARELHDTLLQSFHGLMLRFQAVQNMLPEQPLQAKKSLGLAIDRAAEAITEGRDAVQELRASSTNSNDLVQALTLLGEELGADRAENEPSQRSASFRVLVEGVPRPMPPLLRDDLYRIAREAARNAFRHARASRIEIDIRYDPRMLRLRIRDDGIGMDPNILADGRLEGHWGLPGMRERGGNIGARLEVWSELGRGTEVEVKLPAAIAYRKAPERPSTGRAENKGVGR